MTSRTRKWIFLSGGILLLLVIFALIFNDNQTDAEKFKAALRAKGEKISFAELGLTNVHQSDYMTNLKAFQVATQTNSIFPDHFELMQLVTPQKCVVAWKRDFQPPTSFYSRQPRQQWKPGTNTWDTLSEQLERFKDDFIFLQNLMEDPPKEIGHDYRNLTNWGQFNFAAQRNAAHWLRAAILNDLHFDRHEEALKNLHALISFIRFHENDYTLVNQMIRVAIGGLALSTTWEALQAEDWTEAELAKLQGAWEAVHFQKILERGLIGERGIVDAIFHLATTNRSDFLQVMGMKSSSTAAKIAQGMGVSLWHAFFSSGDEMCALNMSQGAIERCRQLGQVPWPRLKKAGEEAADNFDRQLGGVSKFRFWLSAMIIPHSVRSMATVNRQETARALAITAIALKRFQLRNGRFPTELKALVPEFLSEVPMDRMDLEPLRYRLNADGTFTLYSVGEDGRDNGGTLFSLSNDTTKSKIVPHKNWLEGDDIVWPQPATEEEIARAEAARAEALKTTSAK